MVMKKDKREKHILSLLVDNEPGVLSRVAGFFSGRGFNIDSLCVSETNDPLISRITLVTYGDMMIVEQIKKQLNKLIDVLKVTDISHNKNYIVREFIMVKVSTSKNRPDLLQLINLFRAKVLDLTTNYVVVSLTGAPRKIQRFLEVIQPFGIQELDRSGEFAVLDV